MYYEMSCPYVLERVFSPHHLPTLIWAVLAGKN